jgi:hypothetical protein
MNNMRQLALAIHNYESATGKLPENIKDKNGKPLLSWRVEILPYIEQQAVYQMFKLDEPWDSPANKRASQTVIKTFITPEVPIVVGPNSYGMTNYLGVSGPDTFFDPKGKLRIADIPDGTVNTIMLIETADAVPWAKPDDFVYDANKPLPKIPLLPGRQVFNVALGDGSVRAVSPSVSEKTLRGLFTRSGGEVPGADW